MPSYPHCLHKSSHISGKQCLSSAPALTFSYCRLHAKCIDVFHVILRVTAINISINTINRLIFLTVTFCTFREEGA
jgi:hypothetical protein